MSNKISILLIEDSHTDAKWVERALKKSTTNVYKLSWVETLSKAKEVIQLNTFDVIISDLNLPDEHGIEIAQILDQIAPGVPLVLLTGALQDEVIAIEAMKFGAQDYLFKDELQENELRRVLRHSIERNKLKKELDRANHALQYLVDRDPLTGVLNRRGLKQELKKATAEKKRLGLDFYLLLLDLDDFKSINDKYSHSVGDIALSTITKTMIEILRETDRIARVGGDEFLILLSNTREAEALLVSEKIRLAIWNRKVNLPNDESVRVSASMGLAPLTGEEVSFDELLEKLDSSLKRSKLRGKNQVTLDSGKKQLFKEQESLSPIIDSLKDEGQYSAVFQPIISLQNEEVVGYEALSRFGVEEFEAPNDFFALARAQNLLTVVDQICLKSCFTMSKKLPLKGQFHINIMPSTLIDLSEEFLRKALETQSQDYQYCLELSEQQIIGEPAYLVESVKLLKQLGCLLAIDDLGFGHTSVESLVILDPDIVKIDKSCIIGISLDKAKQANLKRFLKIVQACDAKVIAEGIENEEDLKVVIDLGIVYGQGFHFARPQTLEDTLKNLQLKSEK